MPEVSGEGDIGGCLRASLLSPGYSECVLWTTCAGFTQELIRNAGSQAATSDPLNLNFNRISR